MQPSPASSTASNACQWLARVAAYHDGEMDRASALAFEQHLNCCAPCSTELSELKRLSDSFSALAIRQMRATSVAGIHQAIDAVAQPQSSLLWIGGILSGLAASALIIAGAWLAEAPSPKAPATPIALVVEHGSWEQVAISDRGVAPLPGGQWDQPMLADAAAADWMLQNLSGGATP